MTAESQTQPVLTGDRVALRPWTAADAEEVCAACQDPEIQRWTPVPAPYQHADAVSYVNETAPRVWSEGGALFAVVAIEGGGILRSRWLLRDRRTDVVMYSMLPNDPAATA
jgi:RimJ/RimL family protein N-acetyltransferase